MQDYMLKFLKYEVNVSNLDLSTQSIKMYDPCALGIYIQECGQLEMLHYAYLCFLFL